MSIRALAWAFDLRGLTPHEKLVLLALANSHNDVTGRCWPSAARISDLTGVSARHVVRVIDVLQTRGLVRQQHRPGTSTEYTLAVGVMTVTPDTLSGPDTLSYDTLSDQVRHPVIPPLTPCHTTPDTLSEEPVKNLKRTRRNQMRATRASGRSSARPTRAEARAPSRERGATIRAPEDSAIAPEAEPQAVQTARASPLRLDALPAGISEQRARDWIAHRRAKRAPATQRALDVAMRHAADAAAELNIPADEVIDRCIAAGWTGIEAAWLRQRVSPTTSRRLTPLVDDWSGPIVGLEELLR